MTSFDMNQEIPATKSYTVKTTKDIEDIFFSDISNIFMV